MKTALIIITLLLTAAVLRFFMLGISSKSKEIPGMVNNQLTKCPGTPNCVCSEYASDPGHYIRPVKLPVNRLSENAVLKAVTESIQQLGGKVLRQNKYYIAATFTSRFFGFVDDFETRLDPEHQVIHLRSASRVGRSDLGVNKKRVTLFREIIEKHLSEE